MAGFCWGPAAQIEKFSVAKWNVWFCPQYIKIGDCFILIPNSIPDILHLSDKVDFRAIHPAFMSWDLSCQTSRWMSEYWWTWKMYRGAILSPIQSVEVGRRGWKASLGSPGSAAPLSIFTIFAVKFRERYQSHFEALGLHLFVRDVERCSDDCANSSNPTYSRHTDTHTHRGASAASSPSVSCAPESSHEQVCTVARCGADWRNALAFVATLE